MTGQIPRAPDIHSPDSQYKGHPRPGLKVNPKRQGHHKFVLGAIESPFFRIPKTNLLLERLTFRMSKPKS